MTKTKPHGGKRSGAGRRPVNPEGSTKVIAASVPAELVSRLDEFAVSRKWNRSKAITEAIRGMLGEK